MKVLLLAVLLSACFGGTVGLPEPAAVGTKDAKVIYEFVADYGVGQWRNSPYIKSWDPIELESVPVLVASAGDGTYCPIPSTSPWWAVARKGDRIVCEYGWRMARR